MNTAFWRTLIQRPGIHLVYTVPYFTYRLVSFWKPQVPESEPKEISEEKNLILMYVQYLP